jgi:hypothetical protein
MRFGFFDQLPCADGFSEHQRYKDILAQIDLGDALGFDTVWLGEIHFIRPFSILRGVSALPLEDEAQRRLGVAVAGRDLTGKDQLQPGMECSRDRGRAAQPRVSRAPGRAVRPRGR